jgi:hypothetical protein
MKIAYGLIGAVALLAVSGAADARNFCGGNEPTACVNTMNPRLAERIREKAQQGPEALRRFIDRTRYIHMLDYAEVAGAWYDEKSTYFARRDEPRKLACREDAPTTC